MKANSIFLSSVAIVGLTVANAQVTTTPVGYTTTTLKAGQYNLFGLSVHESVIASGDIESFDAVSITDSDIDFDATLTAGTTYILEISSGTVNGAIQEIVSWAGGSLTTTDDLSASLTIGDTYSLRAAPTIAGVFGAANEAGLLAGGASTADVIWVPDGSGGFNKYYYAVASPPFTTAGWKNVNTGNTDQSSTPLIYTDGMIIHRRGGADLDVTVSGEVKLTSTLLLVDQDYTYVGSSFPAGVTLGSSGLESSLQAGGVDTADVLWFDNGAGGYDKYYYAVAAPPFTTAGWKNVNTGNTDQSAVAIPDAFFIQKRTSGPFNASVTPPAIN